MHKGWCIMKCINSKRLSENIKYLRKYYGESQEELAAAVGAGEKTAVSNYERGIHMPKRDVVFAIAKHYRITADDLINRKYDDLTPIPDKTFGDIEYCKEEISKLFPVITSERALKQEEFTKAANLQKNIYEQISPGYTEYSDWIKCVELYKSSAEKGYREGSANYVRENLLIIFALSLITSKFIWNFDRLKNQTKLAEIIRNNILPAVDDEEYEKEEEYIEFTEFVNEYIEKNRINIIAHIYLLKHSKEYAELGDYYFAWCYKCGLLGISLSQEMRDTVCDTLFSGFATMGNKYAKKLFS